MKIILKNWHRCINMFTYFTTSKNIEKTVMFTEDSKYLLYDDNHISVDQYDLNKLFGFTSGIFGRFGKEIDGANKQDLPFYYRAVHWNSARFAWNYNNSTDKMEVTWYIYDDAIRRYNVYDKAILDFNKKYLMNITKNDKSYTFKIFEIVEPITTIKKVLNIKDYKLIWKKDIAVFSKISKYGMTSILFFGGNKTAPTNIKVSIT